MSTEHEKYMRECFNLARRAVQNGNHPFGSLLVKDGQILLTAENTVYTESDCTRHAELSLVSQACRRFGLDIFSESTLYTSTEPCPMCAGSIYWAGIPVVVFGCSVESLGRFTGGNLAVPCREIFARGRRQVEVIGPILEDEAIRIHEKFWR